MSARKVSVIAAPGGIQGALAVKAATSTIPIVFEMGGDPIALGLVTNLNHPGGNITGATSQNVEVNPKCLEMLHEVMPTAAEFGLLVNPTNPASAETSIKLVKTAADALGLRLQIFEASTERDFDIVFAELAKQRVPGLVIINETFFATRRRHQHQRRLSPGWRLLRKNSQGGETGRLAGGAVSQI
jgi:putative ABC transport system substrate-binding protein